MELVAGIDVGADRAGSHVALIDVVHGRLVAPVAHVHSASEAMELLERLEVCCTAIDAPRRPAHVGDRSRACERELRRRTGCGIFWTPSAAAVDDHYLEGWLRAGFGLFAACAERGLRAEEAFPSASFSLLGERLDGERRAGHTTRLVGELRALLGCSGPALRNQHQRDALAAAWTARACAHDAATWMGEDGDDRIALVDRAALLDTAQIPIGAS